MNNKVYDALKNISLMYLPAASTLYFTLASIWNLPYAEKITGTIAAICAFLGVILKISSNNYNRKKESDDYE